MLILKTDELTEIQCSQVIELAVQRLPGESDYIVSLFNTLICSNIDHFWLLAIDSFGKIQGFCNLRPKKFMIHGQEFNVLGSSYMVTSKLKSSPSAADFLREYLFRESANYDFIIGFARKKMDYYWSRFGFLGLGCYPCLELSLYDIDIQKDCRNLRICEYDQNYLAEISNLYKSLSGSVPNSFHRTSSDWQFLVSNLAYRNNTRLHMIQANGALVGYFIRSDDTILEIYCLPDYFSPLTNSLKAFFEAYYDKIYIKLPDSYPLIASLKLFSHTYSSRLAFEGGHILKVANPESVLFKLETLLHQKLSQSSTLSGNLTVFNGLASVSYQQGIKTSISIEDGSSIDAFIKNVFMSINLHDSSSLFRLGELFFPWLDHF